ncbi:MAG: DUF2147 domain-containing protein [Rhodoferax sp.]|nr:DUF2147 domain-containing protein [Rhodoferax sp.]
MTKNFLVAALVTATSSMAFAQLTPVGTWHTIDDKTREIKSEIQVTEAAGVLSAKVTKLLRKEAKQDAMCTECTDDRKDKPMLGLEIIRGAKKTEGKDVWEEGKILDPENGKVYALKMTPIEGGKKLEVRGSIGPFGRTQTWLRTP